MNAHEWAGRINATWSKSVAAIIETGRLLIEAKDDLGHGKFGKMFSGWPNRGGFGTGLIPFSQRMGQRLMVIASHPILSNPTHESQLPPSWTTLYLLAGLPDEELLDLMDRNVIHAGMERKDVGQIPFITIDQVARAIMALVAFRTRHGKSAEWVAFALAHSTETRSVLVTHHTDLSSDLCDYFRDIIQEVKRLHDERNDDEEWVARQEQENAED